MSTYKPWLSGPGLTLMRARQSHSESEHEQILGPLAQNSTAAARIVKLRDDMFAGRHVNQSEHRAAGHWALRLAGLKASSTYTDTGWPKPLPDHFTPDGEDLLPRMAKTHLQMSALADQVRNGGLVSSSSKKFRHVVHLGIGGSDIGPQLMISALQEPGASHVINARFLANLDYHGVQHCLAELDASATLVVVVSKSFTTQETMMNARHLVDWMTANGVQNPKANFIAVTCQTELAQSWGVRTTSILWFDESIGGRFSLWGPVSFTARVVLGNLTVDGFLQGGVQMDQHFLSTPLVSNLPAVLAATDFFNLRTRRLSTLMVSAYDSRLGLLVPYLKQLWMESLGKHIDANGRPIDGPACPILWGDIGTNAQHAFFQLLHQGAQGVSIDLVGTVAPEHEARQSHEALLANLLAQSQALSTGFASDDAHKTCWGGHPINLLLLDRLTSRHLGALVALWEHRTLCLAALTGVNPFDQWGVELGKSIAKSALRALSEAGTSKYEDQLDEISQSVIAWLKKTYKS